MQGAPRRRLAMVASTALAIAGLLGADAVQAAPPPGMASFSSVPAFTPSFSPTIYDYVVRCEDGPVTVHGQTSGGWEWAVNNNPFHAGDFVEVVPLSSGQAFVITVRKSGGSQRFSTTCAACRTTSPNTPSPATGRCRRSTSRLSRSFAPANEQYGMIFDNHGVPVWWIHAPVQGVRVLADGNILWNNHAVSPARWEIHRLDGSLVRNLGAVGRRADGHDLQFLANGDHLVGSYVKQQHVDTSAYGGSSDASVVNTELQQVSPGGQLRLEMEEPGPHRPGGDRTPLAVGRRPRLRHRPLELDRAGRQLGDRLLQALRRRLQDPQVNRRDRLEAGGHEHPREPRGEGRSLRLHLRRPARRPPAPRRHRDRVRQSHQPGRPDAAGGALQDRPSRRERRPSWSRSPTPPCPSPTAAARPGGWTMGNG